MLESHWEWGDDMRIVTRPDFDGIVCAVLIYEAQEGVTAPILWVEPSQVQNGEAEIQKGDIMANLPYDPRCSVWFDHHYSNTMESKVEGAFKIAPSAAGVAYEYYLQKGLLQPVFNELIQETDIIDAADLNKDQVLKPENYPYILLSMTVKNRDELDPPYWEKLVDLLRQKDITAIMDDPEVKKRAKLVVAENKAFVGILKEHTRTFGHVSLADFRSMAKAPSGNRFLTYSLFPDTVVSVKIRFDDKDKNIVILSIGHSIFNQGCQVNVGKLLARYGGGGHAGAGGCSMDASLADEKLQEIMDILQANQPI